MSLQELVKFGNCFFDPTLVKLWKFETYKKEDFQVVLVIDGTHQDIRLDKESSVEFLKYVGYEIVDYELARVS